MTALDIAQLRAWCGRTSVAEDRITPRLIAEFATTLDPQLAPCAAGEAPLGLHWCLAPRVAPMRELGRDGHPALGDDLPPVPLPRRMWAGGEIEFLAPLRVDDVVTRTSTITDVQHKRGRAGDLVFVAVRNDYATPRGLALRDRQDIVYLAERTPEESPPPAAPEPEAQAEPDLAWRLETGATLLFRYSAMTFNGHRIHYDHSYATAVEGYRGLVVHGPLQATLLLNASAVLAGRAPRRFNYRSIGTIIAGDPLRVELTRRADGIAGCCRGASGAVAMTALAILD